MIWDIVKISINESNIGEGGFNRGGRRKNLDIEGYRMDRKLPSRGRLHFHDHIEC